MLSPVLPLVTASQKPPGASVLNQPWQIFTRHRDRRCSEHLSQDHNFEAFQPLLNPISQLDRQRGEEMLKPGKRLPPAGLYIMDALDFLPQGCLGDEDKSELDTQWYSNAPSDAEKEKRLNCFSWHSHIHVLHSCGKREALNSWLTEINKEQETWEFCRLQHCCFPSNGIPAQNCDKTSLIRPQNSTNKANRETHNVKQSAG